MHIRRTLLAGAVMLAACENGSAPDGPEGRYTLAAVEADALPAFANPYQPGGSGREIVDAALTLSAPDQAMFVMRSRLVEGNGTRGAMENDTVRARYTLRGTALTFAGLGAARFRLGAEATLQSNRRLDTVLMIPMAASQGFAEFPTALRFSR
jgi:hypothetical protein